MSDLFIAFKNCIIAIPCTLCRLPRQLYCTYTRVCLSRYEYTRVKNETGQSWKRRKVRCTLKFRRRISFAILSSEMNEPSPRIQPCFSITLYSTVFVKDTLFVSLRFQLYNEFFFNDSNRKIKRITNCTVAPFVVQLTICSRRHPM